MNISDKFLAVLLLLMFTSCTTGVYQPKVECYEATYTLKNDEEYFNDFQRTKKGKALRYWKLYARKELRELDSLKFVYNKTNDTIISMEFNSIAGCERTTTELYSRLDSLCIKENACSPTVISRDYKHLFEPIHNAVRNWDIDSLKLMLKRYPVTTHDYYTFSRSIVRNDSLISKQIYYTLEPINF